METGDDIYLIKFKIEGVEQLSEEGVDGDEDGVFDMEEDDLFDEELGKENKELEKNKQAEEDKSKEDEGKDKQQGSRAGTTPKSRTVKNLSSLFEEEELTYSHEFEKSVCLNLLKAMEIEGSEVDESEERELDLDKEQGEELVNLPSEWTYSYSGNEKEEAENSRQQAVIVVGENVVETAEIKKTLVPDFEDDHTAKGKEVVQNEGGDNENATGHIEGEDVKKVAKKRNQKWGPVIPERKSKRCPLGPGTAMEKAQALKKKNNLEVTEGNSLVRCEELTSKDCCTAPLLAHSMPPRVERGVLVETVKTEADRYSASKNLWLTQVTDKWDNFLFDHALTWNGGELPEEAVKKFEDQTNTGGKKWSRLEF